MIKTEKKKILKNLLSTVPRGTQAELARFAQVHPRAISFWLKDDQRWMTRKTEAKVWRFFYEHGFDVPELLRRERHEQTVEKAVLVPHTRTGEKHALSFRGLDVSVTPAYILDLETTSVVYINEAAAHLVGLNRQDCFGMSTEDMLRRVHPEDREVWWRFHHALADLPPGTSVNLEFRVQTEIDGQRPPVWRWFHACQTTSDIAGLGRVLIGIAFDIRRAQLGASPVRKAEDRALTLPLLAPLVRARQSRKLKELLLYLALTTEQLGAQLGVPAGEVTAWLEGRLALGERDKKIMAYEFSVPESWWEQEEGSVAETSSREQQIERLKAAAIRSTAVLIYIFSLRTHRNEYINPAMERLLGMSAEQMRQFPPELMNTLIHPEDQDCFWGHITEIATRPTGTAENCEYRLKVGADGQGRPRWCWIHVNHTLGKAGSDQIVIGYGLVSEKAQTRSATE